eukprot:Sspe_Gene.39450::Locus_19031_Transcript_2_3_Confidence_0.400_Length_4788::g.39450::m.39450
MALGAQGVMWGILVVVVVGVAEGVCVPTAPVNKWDKDCGWNSAFLADLLKNETLFCREACGLPRTDVAIDYAMLEASPKYQQYLDSLSAFPCEQLADIEGSSPQAFYSLWINLFNFMGLYAVTANPCQTDAFGSCRAITTIKDLASTATPLWDISILSFCGMKLTFQFVEDRMRKPPQGVCTRWPEKWKKSGACRFDGRVHAALTPSSRSCLFRNEPYVPRDLDTQLDSQWTTYFSDDRKGMNWSNATSTVEVTPVVDWFSVDLVEYMSWRMGNESATLVDFLSFYTASSSTRAEMEKASKAGRLSIAYFDYDWQLNGHNVPCNVKCRYCWPLPLVVFVFAFIGILVVDAAAVVITRWRKRAPKVESLEEEALLNAEQAEPPVSTRLATAKFIMQLDIFIILVVLLVYGLLYYKSLAQGLKSALVFIDDNRLEGALFFIVLYIVATIICLPCAILTLGAGYIFGLLLGTVVVLIGATCGMSATFVLGATLFRSRVEGLTRSNKKIAKVHEIMKQEGLKVCFLLRLAPIFPYNLLNYFLAVTGMPFWHFFAASSLGIIPGTVMYTYFGSAAHSIQDLISGNVENRTMTIVLSVVSGVIIIGVTVFIVVLARRKLRNEFDLTCAEGNEEEGTADAPSDNL